MKSNKLKFIALVASFFIFCGCSLMGTGSNICIIQPEHGKIEVSLAGTETLNTRYKFLITAIPEEGYKTDVNNIFAIRDSIMDNDVYSTVSEYITEEGASGTKFILKVGSFSELVVTARFYKVK